MTIKINLSILTIAAILSIAVGTAVGITMAGAITHFICSNAHKRNIDDSALWNTDENRQVIKKTLPVIKIDETSDAKEQLLLINVIQRVLEKTIKTNTEIAYMAVYSDDGKIIAHIKPERIGKNMFDADVEFSGFLQDIFDAVKHRKIYGGFTYDPLFNDSIRFIVKPFQVSNLTNNLSLLIGIPESYMQETEWTPARLPLE